MTPSNAKQAELAELLTQLCDGKARQPELDRLEVLLLDDPESQEFYRRFVALDVDLAWHVAYRAVSPSFGLSIQPESEEADEAEGVQRSHQPNDSNVDASSSLVPTPVAPIDPAFFVNPRSALFDLDSPVGSFVFSYSVAAVLFGLGMLIGSVIYVTHHTAQLARTGSDSGERQSSEKFVKPTYVGEITGMVDVKWVDLQKAPLSNYVILGRQYDLASGLVEITYDTGVRVILQGPCTYEIESAAGGYLSLGKLTARIEKNKAANQKSNPQSLIPNPLFAVRTPTAVVTDLGTEFGVEVAKSGATESYVYQGKVEMRMVGDQANTAGAVTLKANESARIAAGENQVITVIRGEGKADEPKSFVRELPQRVPIELFNTGVGLEEDDIDPHWQIVARSDDPNFKPRSAVVTRVDAPVGLPNDPAKSQWISTSGDLPLLPGNVIYSFRTAFDLDGFWSDSAIVRGQFIADNHVRAIRFNGQDLALPSRGSNFPFVRFSPFLIHNGFIEGTNTLEFDVENFGSHRPGDENPMCLRVELKGAALRKPNVLSTKETHFEHRKKGQENPQKNVLKQTNPSPSAE